MAKTIAQKSSTPSGRQVYSNTTNKKRPKQPPLTNAKMFTASWTERDEAILVDLLKRKISEMRYEIKKADSPYIKAKLRKTRKEYRGLLDKIETGDYDPDILAAEMKTQAAYRGLKDQSNATRASKYVDSYTEMDFDYDAYFTKTRYFGAALPFVTLILVLVFALLIISSSFLPTDLIKKINDFMPEHINLSLTGVYNFKVEKGLEDFRIPNNGKWPTGTFTNPEQALEYGEIYQNEDGTPQETVLVAEELGMNSIQVSTFDLIKALLRTPAVAKNDLGAIEKMDAMQGYSYYYVKYIRDRASDIEIKKDENGKYNNVALVKRIATYGTIWALAIMLLLSFVEIVLNVGRMFSYTSRRFHIIPLLIVLCGALVIILPGFLEMTALTGDGIGTAFRNHFTTSWADFNDDPSIKAIFNILWAIFLALPLLAVFLPKMFKNKSLKQVTYVPKGNKPHTYTGDTQPTAPGQPGQRSKKSKGKFVAAGSKPGYSRDLPTSKY